MPAPCRLVGPMPGARFCSRARRGVAVLLAGLVALPIAWANPAAAPRKPERPPGVMVLTRIEASGTQAVAGALVAEAFRRHGLDVAIEAVPAERAMAMTREGRSDGEVSRIASYFEARPELVRVTPALMVTEAAVFVRVDDPRFIGRELDSPATLRGLRVGIVRGVLQTRRAVATLEGVESVSSARQLHRMLQAGRLDAIVDTPLNHRRYRIPDGAPGATRQAGRLGAEPVFLGLQARHGPLAGPLGATIRAMQESGEWERFRGLAEDAYVERTHR